MNLLIVEDEIRLRNALANNIQWDKHGIEVVGQAGNGLEALRIMDIKKPDIILLDLQMPEMDGLTLARRLRESDPLLKIIVLSGHDDFTFAQEALDLGVMKYLLKPAGDAEILETVLEAAERLKSELEQRHNEDELRQKWKLHLPYLINEFFQGWLNGKFEPWEIEQKSKDLQLELPSDTVFGVAVVDMDPLSEDETRFSRNDMSLLQFSLGRILTEALVSSPCWVSTNSAGCSVIIFQLADQEEPKVALQKINAMTEKLLFTVKSCLKLSASAGISGMIGSLADMNKLYVQAMRALQNRIVFGHDLAIPYREEQGREPELTLQPNLEKALEIALETGDGDKALETLTALWNGGMAKAETVEDMREHILYFTSLFISLIQKQGWPVREVAGDDYVYFHNHMELASKEQILSWLQRMIRAYFVYAGHRRKSTSHGMIKTILSLVENEIDQEMTLHAVADRLYVNSSYLSRLFKQETGKAFSTYVLERKMEKAKMILQEGSRVYDAASSVGYRDVSYFTRVFRKYWGITPGEVRS
ncbi:two-component system response regulator [Paenibacillus pectinilyticus]|uniref:Two-component system response regulator n=1 Tax=Paenibacillus pectinilyticus TaxID=512399 RepID=A0A1C0ZVX5_9BACL|nr:response regulator [Paenibacillus pectinilyticus]OCT12227.1 two-component system response regulator [Paenibacillus pectinilyticus]